MFKKIRINLLLISLLQLSSIWASAHQEKKENIVFVWDLHGVVLKPRSKVRAFRKYPNKKKALRQTKLRHKFLKCIVKAKFKGISSEELFELGNRYENPHFNEMILHADVAQKPMDDTIAIIQELAQNGYTHHVGSNIGNTTFKAMTNAKQYPQFQHVFEHFDLEKSQVVDNVKTQKPSPQFFINYLKKNKIDPAKTRVVFIDNDKKNVKAAVSVGLEGIHFKNAIQLRQELALIGIQITV